MIFLGERFRRILFSGIFFRVNVSAMDFHILEPFRVRFSETDSAGIVHFSNILRWAENAESDFFRQNGFAFVEKKEAGTLSGWPRVRVRVDFLAPARYDDLICVKIRPMSVPAENSVALNWEFEVAVLPKNENSEERLIANGNWTSVYASINTLDGIVRSEKEIPPNFRKFLNFIKTA